MTPTQFLAHLFGDGTFPGPCALWSPQAGTRWLFDASDADTVVAGLDGDVYFGCGLHRTIPDTGRGGADSVGWVPGMWVDLDAKEGRTKDDCLELVDQLEVQPSLVVDSGRGLHLYWLAKDGLVDVDVGTGAALVRWGRGVARELGVELDPVWDLARVLRVPGTTNTKDGSAVRVVRVGNRYLWRGLVGFYGDADAATKLESESGVRARDLSPMERSPARIRSALNALDPDLPYQEWLRVGMALHSVDAFDAWREWSARGSKWCGDAELASKWASFGDGNVGLQTLFYLARQTGWCPDEVDRPLGMLRFVDAYRQARDRVPSHHLAGTIQHSTDWLAWMVRESWCSFGGTWHHWTGTHWQRHPTTSEGDATVSAWAATRMLDLAQELEDDDEGEAASAIRTAARMIANSLQPAKRAHGNPRCSAQLERPKHEQDREARELNTLSGTLDLWSRRLRRHARFDFTTAVVPLEVDPEAECPRWDRFLREVLYDDPELVDYLARWFGYTLTTSTRAQASLWLIGPGGNGKSVILSVLRSLLGGFAKVTGHHLLMGGDEAMRRRASLPGKRAVIVDETPPGFALDAQAFKALVASTELDARAMYGDDFTFQSTAKLWVASNDYPVAPGAGFAVWRRIQVLNMTRIFRIEDGTADPDLVDTLSAELPGILRWALNGLEDWREQGLRPPARASGFLDDFKAEADPFALFAELVLERIPAADATTGVTTAKVAQEFQRWALKLDLEGSASAVLVGRKLRAYGFQQNPSRRNGRKWLVRIRQRELFLS